MRLMQPISASDHVLGPRDAAVTLVEYVDYECPFCARAQVVVERVLSQAADRVRFVPRHFPLTDMHPHALLAAQAAEAAGAQNEFWGMSKALFRNQRALEAQDLIAYAEGLGLDVQRFIEELREEAHLPKVKADFRGGIRSGVNGTPAFFVNGFRHDRGWDASTLTEALRDAAREPLAFR